MEADPSLSSSLSAGLVRSEMLHGLHCDPCQRQGCYSEADFPEAGDGGLGKKERVDMLDGAGVFCCHEELLHGMSLVVKWEIEKRKSKASTFVNYSVLISAMCLVFDCAVLIQTSGFFSLWSLFAR
jgi:hypothetical protein